MSNPYQVLFESYKKANPTLKPGQAQDNVNELWRSAKKNFGTRRKVEFHRYIANIIEELKRNITHETPGTITSVYQTPPKKTQTLREAALRASARTAAAELTGLSSMSPDKLTPSEDRDDRPYRKGIKRKALALLATSDDEESIDDTPHREHSTPAQDSIRQRIILLESELNSAVLARDSGLCGPNVQAEVETLRESLSDEQKKLKRIIENAERQKQFRRARKKTLQKLIFSSSEAEAVDGLNVHEEPGRPRLNDEANLIQTICDIAKLGGFKTLDDLHSTLKEKGFSLSRSATYLRLLPKNDKTAEAKRHIVTAPVRLRRNKKEHSDEKLSIDSEIVGSRSTCDDINVPSSTTRHTSFPDDNQFPHEPDDNDVDVDFDSKEGILDINLNMDHTSVIQTKNKYEDNSVEDEDLSLNLDEDVRLQYLKSKLDIEMEELRVMKIHYEMEWKARMRVLELQKNRETEEIRLKELKMKAKLRYYESQIPVKM